MANWNQPALTDTYANFLAFLNAKVADSALGLDPAHTTVTNPPANSIRYNSASNRWEKFVSGSWGALSSGYAISITGNAATATTLATARTINGVSFNGSANITIPSNTAQSITFNNGGAGAASGTTFDGGTARVISYNTVGAPSATGAGASGSWAINAATVTNGVYTTGDQAISGVKTFNSSRVQVSGGGVAMLELHVPGNHARGFYLDAAGVTRLASTNGSGVASTVYLSIDGTGNLVASGDVTAYSDERLKINWRDLPIDFLDRLARVKMGIYERKDTGHTQVGVGAQSLRDHAMPMAVLEGAGGTLSVAYGNAALAACVALAREVLTLKAQVAELKG